MTELSLQNEHRSIEFPATPKPLTKISDPGNTVYWTRESPKEFLRVYFTLLALWWSGTSGRSPLLASIKDMSLRILWDNIFCCNQQRKNSTSPFYWMISKEFGMQSGLACLLLSVKHSNQCKQLIFWICFVSLFSRRLFLS